MKPTALFFLLTVGSMAAPALNGAVLTVDATLPSAPFHTIQAALDQAKAGDVVHVDPGVYRERVVFKNGGTADQPVTLEGAPGAVIDGSNDVKLDWQPAPDIGPGVYVLPVDFFAYTIAVNGQLITTLNEKRVNPEKEQPIHNGWKNLNWHEVFGGAGVGPSGWKGVRGLAMYQAAEKRLIIRFDGEVDPHTLAITIGPREPCIHINGQSYCVVRGLTIRNAATGVLVENSTGTIIDHCTLGPIDYAIDLDQGAAQCEVYANDISYRPYADSSYTGEGEWDNWQACKTGGFQDRWAVRMFLSLGGHHIHDNYIHDEWDGVDTAATIYLADQKPHFGGDAKTNSGIEVDHNLFFHVFDDAIETAGPVAHGRYHDNIFNHARCAFRIKSPTLGPIFSYRNIFLDNGEDYRNWGEISGVVAYDPNITKTEVWVYQNTSTSPSAVTMNYSADGPKEAISAVNYHYVNNLFWCGKWVGKKASFPNPDWQGDHNVFVFASEQNPKPWPANPDMAPVSADRRLQDWNDGIALAKVSHIDEHSLWVADKPPGFVDAANGDMALTADSPARGQGIDLSQVKASDGTPLPGCEPGYFKGPAPDVGALQFGDPMPKLPRKPAGTTAVVPAG